MNAFLYFATNQGVVAAKSEDGHKWAVESHGLKDWTVPEVAVVPGAPNKVYAGTRGDGVWYSDDFGKNWKKPCYGKHGPGKVRCITLDPHDPDTIYAGTEPIDIFVSRDGARSWTRLESVWNVPVVASVTYPVATVEPHIRDITLDPNDSNTIYAALQVGYMLKSQDGGASWTLLDKDVDADVHTIAINPKQTERLFVATGGHDFRKGVAKGRALYASNDAGATWVPTGADIAEEYSVPLVINPENPNIMFSAVANGQPGQWRGREWGAESSIVRTMDGGKSWKKIDGSLPEIRQYFAEGIAVDEEEPDRIYAALKNGMLFVGEDNGDSWSKTDLKVPAVSGVKYMNG